MGSQRFHNHLSFWRHVLPVLSIARNSGAIAAWQSGAAQERHKMVRCGAVGSRGDRGRNRGAVRGGYRNCSITIVFSTESEASDEGETTDGWEEEDEAEPKIGDGGDGGGVALHNVPWGQRALSIAEEVLKGFTEDVELYAFKTTPRGYVYVRLDKLTHEYGCPSIEELERYNQEYKKRLDEVGALGEIPDDLGLEVSSPGAERILKVPDDLNRFKDMPMRVCYTENADSNCTEEDGVYFLDSIEEESGTCVWKLADVKENRDPLRKGRPLTRKQKDWRLKLPFNMHKLVTLYLA